MITVTDMTFEEWLTYGMDRHWIGPPVCDTCDGVPMSADEELDWVRGNEQCIYILRLYADLEERRAVESNHDASRWRQRR